MQIIRMIITAIQPPATINYSVNIDIAVNGRNAADAQLEALKHRLLEALGNR